MKKITALDACPIIKADIESILNDHIIDFKLYEFLCNFHNNYFLDDFIPSYIAQFYMYEYNFRISRLFSAASKYCFFSFSVDNLEVSLVPHEYDLPFPTILNMLKIQKDGSYCVELNISVMDKHYEFSKDKHGDLHIDFLM